MATSRPLLLLCLLLSAAAGAREASSPASCKAAAAQPPIADAKLQVSKEPDDLKSRFRLADAWSDAGCFNDALQVLEDAAQSHSDKELQTRLRVARSVVGEEHYFDNLDRANDAARLKRAAFRCKTLNDLDACNEAVHTQPDDAQLVIAQGDALMHAKRPGEALTRYELAQGLGGDNGDVASKIAAAEELAGSPHAQAAAANTSPPAPTRLAAGQPQSAARMAADRPPPRRYSNLAPESQSH